MIFCITQEGKREKVEDGEDMRTFKISKKEEFDARYWTFIYNFGKKVVLLPKLYVNHITIFLTKF